MQFDRSDIRLNKLVATTLESKIIAWDMRTYNTTTKYASVTTNAQSSTVWCVRHLPQNRDLFLTSAGDGSVVLWR